MPDDLEVSPFGGGVRKYALNAGHAEAFRAKAGELLGERY